MKKVVLVIGGSSGIGEAAVKQFLKNDFTVYNGSRRECEVAGVKNLTVDVCLVSSIETAVKTVYSEQARIDILVYSAGYSMAAPLEHVQSGDYRYLYEVNLFGAMETAKRVIPIMREQKSGRIIFVSSVGGVLPIAFDNYYSSSKAALNMLAKTLNLELSPYNIFVSSVMPGGTATEFTFKRNVYDDNKIGTYKDCMAKAVIALANIEQGGMTAEAVAETIFNTALSISPPQETASGFINKTYALADKLLPTKLSMYMNRNKYHQ